MADSYRSRARAPVTRLASTSSIYSDDQYDDAREYEPDYESNQSVNQPISQLNDLYEPNQSYDLPKSRSVNQSVKSQSINQPIKSRSAPRSADLFDEESYFDDNQPIHDQSINQSINQSIRSKYRDDYIPSSQRQRSINQPINQSINQSRQPVLSPSSLDTFDPLNSGRKKAQSSVYSFDQPINQSLSLANDSVSYSLDDNLIDSQFQSSMRVSSNRQKSINQSINQAIKQSSNQSNSQSHAIALDPDVADEAEMALAEALGQPTRRRPNQSINQRSNQSINHSHQSVNQSHPSTYSKPRRVPDSYDQYEQPSPRRPIKQIVSQSINPSINQSAGYSKRPAEMKEYVSRAGIIEEAPINFDDESVLQQPVQSLNQTARAVSNQSINQSARNISNHSINQSVEKPTLRRQFSPEQLLHDELEFDRQLASRDTLRRPINNQSINQSINQRSPNNQSINSRPSHNQSVNQRRPVSREDDESDPDDQPIRRNVRQPINQSINQSINRSTNRSVNRTLPRHESSSESEDDQPRRPAVNQPINHSIKPSIRKSTRSPERSSRTDQSITQSSSQSINQSSRPKSVRVDAMTFMKAGTPFLKYGSSWMAVPHFRLLSLSSDCQSIVWFSEKKSLTESRILLNKIDSIVEGQTTAAFAKHRAVELEANSFSILYQTSDGKSKTLDLTAKDLNEMRIWIAGLQKMIRFIKTGRDLTQMRRCLVEIQLHYGGAPSQDIVDYDSGRLIDVRKKSNVQKLIERDWSDRQDPNDRQVNAQLYSELQPRFASLQETLTKHREQLRESSYSHLAEYSVMASIVARVERSVRSISDWMLDGELELADQEIWRAQVDLDSLSNMFKALKQ